MTTHASPRSLEWILVLSAAVVLMITTGARLTTGLFLAPINASTGLGIVAVSFAIAVGQFIWGLSQPFFGAVADKYGPGRVIVLGGLLLAAGTALTTLSKSQFALVATLGILSAAGAGAGSFSTLIGAVAQRIGPERRAFTSGVINAGGSAGQLVYAPVTQALINSFGWTFAMLAVAASTLATLPLAWPLRRKRAASISEPRARSGPDGLWPQLDAALRDRSYLCLHAGFFTCGFHIAFLVTHMPGEVELCGLPVTVSANALAIIGLFNIAGSLAAGALSARYRMKHLLAALYASRAVIIMVYLLSPKNAPV
jgi:predicted MFS family arabinose efflux permease